MAALLGDMYELGECSEKAHEGVGLDFARRGGDLLFTYGELADGIASGAILGGADTQNVFRNADISRPDISGEMIIKTLRKGDMLLIKGSRGVRAERVIEYLMQNENRLRF